MASTFLTSIPAALILYDPVLNDTGYILCAGDDTRVTLGALLEILLMIGNVGTAVVMFPILRRYSETLSLSYVASRMIEATILLGWMMYRTELMPPRLAMLGVIGGPLIFLSSIAVLFDVYAQDGLHALFSIPEGAFEAAFAIYLIVKGFRPSPILDDTRFGGGEGGSLRPAAAP
jgi:hypothetical protein